MRDANASARQGTPAVNACAPQSNKPEGLAHGVHLPRTHAVRRLQAQGRAPHVLRYDNPPDLSIGESEPTTRHRKEYPDKHRYAEYNTSLPAVLQSLRTIMR